MRDPDGGLVCVDKSYRINVYKSYSLRLEILQLLLFELEFDELCFYIKYMKKIILQ